MHIWLVSLSNLLKGTWSLDKEERNFWLIGSPLLKIKGNNLEIICYKSPWTGVSFGSPGFGNLWLSNLAPAGSGKTTARWFWLLLGKKARKHLSALIQNSVKPVENLWVWGILNHFQRVENSRERLNPAHVRSRGQGNFSAPGNGKKKKVLAKSGS